MDGVIYYPYIRVPASAWFSRAVLYWDSVATIVPDQWIADPDKLGPYTRELVQLGVVTQLLPSYADLISLGNRFAEYINHLVPEELAKRRRDFAAGVTESIHSDKGVAEAFYGLEDQHLCSPAGQWWRVERATAADYMAALALALSLPGHNMMKHDTHAQIVPDTTVRRVPITDELHSLLPLLAGSLDEDDSVLRERAEGLAIVGRIQMMVLENLFPAPVVAIPPTDIDRFRRRHAGLVPAFRREIEERVDTIFKLENRWEQRRALDRLESEFKEAIEQVESYMSESRFGRIVRSPWCGLLALIPGLDRLISGGRAIADVADPQPDAVRSPLAYAAFLSVEVARREHRPRVLENRANPLLTAAFTPSE
jgi:hypothetical protein